jgi:hypothetical protein
MFDVFLAPALCRGLILGIDARDTRRPGMWDGRVQVSFRVQQGDEISTDDIELRCSSTRAQLSRPSRADTVYSWRQNSLPMVAPLHS